MMHEELKDCPFCGKKPKMMSCNLSNPFFVVCTGCLVQQNDFYHKEEYAIDAWNERDGVR